MKTSLFALEEIKNKLSSERVKLIATLESLASQDPYSNPDRLNDNAASDTEASEESSHERVEALEKEIKTHISEIDTAILKIEQGTYGVCMMCNKDIGMDRLAIKPTAFYCVECERKRSE